MAHVRQKLRRRAPRRALQQADEELYDLEPAPQWQPDPDRTGRLPHWREVKDAIDFEKVEWEHGLPPGTQERLEFLAGGTIAGGAWVAFVEIAVRRPWLLVVAAGVQRDGVVQ